MNSLQSLNKTEPEDRAIRASRTTLRTTRLASLMMAILALCGLLVTLFTFIINDNSSKVIDTLNRQIDAWDATEETIFSNVEFVTGDTFNEQYTLRRKQRLARLVAELSENRAKLHKLENQSFFGVRLNRFHEPLPFVQHDDFFQETIDQLQKLSSSSEKTELFSPDVHIGAMGAIFTNGGYRLKMKRSLDIARVRHERTIAISYRLLFGLGLLFIVGTVLIQVGIVTPAIKKLMRTHEREAKYLVEIHEQKVLTDTAFHSLPYIAAVLDSKGELIVSNDLFDELMFLSGKRNALEFFSSMAQTWEGANFKAYDDGEISVIADLLSSGENVRVAGKLIGWATTYIHGERFMFVGSDNTELAAIQEAQGHHERLEALGRIASGIAHDFNNILGGIAMRAELALADPQAQELYGSTFESFIESSMRAKSLISQLQSYSRKQTFRVEPVKVSVLENQLREQLIAPSNIELTLTRSSSAIIEIDANFFVTAIENIVQNSIFAIGEKPGSIRIRMIDSKQVDHVPYLQITVEDTGGGFSPEALRSATEPFFSTKGPMHGSGLGLAMVAGFVAQSKGILSIENGSEGAIICVSFPISNKQAVQKVEPEEEENDLLVYPYDQTCVVLEDDKQIGTMQQMFLRKFFQEVELFTTVGECCSRLRNDAPIGLAIFDWSLPDGVSHDAILLCRKKHPDAQIVVATGNVEVSLEKLARENEVMIMEKPVRLSELTNTINKVAS